MRLVTATLVTAVSVSACAPGEPAGSASDASTTSTGTTMTATTTTGTTTTSTEGSTSSTAPTTGAGSTTGEPGMCPPRGELIPEEEFATRFAEAICAQKEACGCETDFICVSTFKQQFELVHQYAMDHAPHYDAACAGALLAAAVEQRGCRTRSQWYEDVECWPDCVVFRGDVPSSGACASTGPDNSAYSDVCADEDEYCQILDSLTCEPYDLPTVGVGEPCRGPDDQTLAWCEVGTACSGTTDVCVPVVGEGETCVDVLGCQPSLWCNAQGVCEPRKPDGAPCESNAECTSLECTDGSCDDFIIMCRVDSPSDLVYTFTL